MARSSCSTVGYSTRVQLSSANLTLGLLFDLCVGDPCHTLNLDLLFDPYIRDGLVTGATLTLLFDPCLGESLHFTSSSSNVQLLVDVRGRLL